jgi:hypothetical protein
MSAVTLPSDCAEGSHPSFDEGRFSSLNCRPAVNPFAPVHEGWIVALIEAMPIDVFAPRKGCNVGDRIVVACQPSAIRDAIIDLSIQALRQSFVASACIRLAACG